MSPHVLGRLDCEHLVRESHKLVAGASVADPNEMDVAVHESGHDGGVAVVHLANGRPLRRLDRLVCPNLANTVAVQQNSRLLRNRPAVAIDQPRGLQDCEFRAVWHWCFSHCRSVGDRRSISVEWVRTNLCMLAR